MILAVIPQYNKAIYLNQNGRIDKHINNINPLCDTLLFLCQRHTGGQSVCKRNRNFSFSHFSHQRKNCSKKNAGNPFIPVQHRTPQRIRFSLVLRFVGQ